jgi:predicted DNA-binding transcriptional regulator AlpA
MDTEARMTHATEAGTTTGTRRYARDYQGRDLWRRLEVLDYLRISSPTLIRWSRRAQFPRPIRMGRAPVWRKADILAWLASREAA